MEVIDILNELDDKDRLRNIVVGGYIKRRIPRPPIFSREVLAEDCKFVEFKLIYATNQRGKRILTAGEIVAFVSNEVDEKDFYEFRGTLSLAGMEYSRVVTMMNFKKQNTEANDKGYVWAVHPVQVSDLELSHLNNELYAEVMKFAEAPISYNNGNLDYILRPVAEQSDTSKIYYDFSDTTKTSIGRPFSKKDKTEFEEENNYLIDDEYEILREGLRYNRLALNISDFANDKMIVKYAEWIADFDIKVVNKMSEVSDEDSFAVILTDRKLEGLPYIELKRGVSNLWGI